MSWWGKLLGGAFGYMLVDPLGEDEDDHCEGDDRGDDGDQPDAVHDIGKLIR